MRGGGRSRVQRIIPAYAGSTKIDPTAPISLSGSSPHTRGAQFSFQSRGAFPRIIPAYAGSTKTAPTTPKSTKDHPRIRGEHF